MNKKKNNWYAKRRNKVASTDKPSLKKISWKERITIVRLTQITIVVGLVFIIIAAFLIGFSKERLSSDVVGGSIITYRQDSSNTWAKPNGGTIRNASAEEQYIKNNLPNAPGFQDKFGSLTRIDFSINPGKSHDPSAGGTSLPITSVIIKTNITNYGDAEQLESMIWKLNYPNQAISSNQISYDKFTPNFVNSYIIASAVAIAASIGFVFIYSIFRLNWAQFFSVVSTGLFAGVLTLAIIITFQITISLTMFPIVAAIWAFAMVSCSFFMAQVNQNRRFFNLDDYDLFYQNELEYRDKKKDLLAIIKFNNYKALKRNAKQNVNYLLNRDNIKRYRKDIKADILEQKKILYSDNPIYIRKQVQQMVRHLEDPEEKRNKRREYFLQLKEGEAAQNSIQIRTEKNNKIIASKQELKKIKHEFHQYNNKNNFLYKMVNMSLKKQIFEFLGLGIIAAIILIPLAIFSGPSFGFFITVLIGIITSFYAIFVIAIPIWIRLESLRALNRTRIQKNLRKKHVEIDEEEIIGVNATL